MKLNPLMLAVLLCIALAVAPGVSADYGSYTEPSIMLSFDNTTIDQSYLAGFSNASEIGSVTYVPGVFGNAVSVNASASVQIDYLDEITADSYSFCMYEYKITSFPNTYFRTHYLWNTTGNAEMEWNEYRNQTPTFTPLDRLDWGRCDDWTCNNGIERYWNNTENQANNWTFNCYVYNETDFDYYINGVHQEEISNTDFGTYTHVRHGWDELDIYLFKTGFVQSTGYIDEYYFYEHALDDGNVSALYSNLPIDAPSPCVPNWECIGYDTPVCLIDDTNTASCNAVNDTNTCGEIYTGDYSEFINQTGVCDYCVPNWSCSGYVNTTCVVINGTGSLTQSCNQATDSNGCFALTGLPSDNYIGDYTEFGQSVLECPADLQTKASYGIGLLVALIPLLFVAGFFISSDWYKKRETNNQTKIIAGVTTIIIVLIIIALL